MKKDTLISVLLPVYNCSNTLSDAIGCIIKQTYTNWELIICDDGSTDDTLTVVEKFHEEYPENIKVLKNEENKGLNYTLNRCLQNACGEYIARMDGDDLCSSERFAIEIAELEKDKNIAIVSTDMEFFDEVSIWGMISHPDYPVERDFIKESPFAHAPCMVRKCAYDDVHGYTVDRKLLRVEDYYLWVKMYALGYKGKNIHIPLYQMRDDRNAYSRRKFIYRLNEAYVKGAAVKQLHLPIWMYIYCLKPIVIGLLPRFLYDYLHRKRLANDNTRRKL